MFFLYVGSLERMPERLTVLLTDLHFTWNEENVSQHTKKGGIYQRREREIPTNVNNQHRRSAFNMMGFFNGDGCDHTQPTVMFYGPHKNHKTFFSIFFFSSFLAPSNQMTHPTILSTVLLFWGRSKQLHFWLCGQRIF